MHFMYTRAQCDDVDITPRLRQGKFHCILFLNIPYYAGGVQPWGGLHNAHHVRVVKFHTTTDAQGSTVELNEPTSNAASTMSAVPTTTFVNASTSDGLVEVLGFTTATLVSECG
jgi:hypothetical protein